MSQSQRDNTPRADEVPSHLQLIQSVITRMSTASSSAKSWLLPVVVAAYGYALTSDSVPVALLGVGAVIVFAYLDANYLREEKRYRRLYEAVISGKPLTRFSLDTGEAPVPDAGCSEEWPDSSRLPNWYRRYIPPRKVWASWSIAPFYLALAVGGAGIALTLALS